MQSDKLKDLTHYICHKCENPNKFGATKINKVLWFVDSVVYRQNGKSITECKYKKLQHGPVPVEIGRVLSELEAENKLVIREDSYFGYTQKKFISLADPATNCFSDEELSLVDIFVSHICDNHTASSINELSHDDVWEAARIGEEIPLQAVHATDYGEISQEDLEWADCVIDRYSVS